MKRNRISKKNLGLLIIYIILLFPYIKNDFLYMYDWFKLIYKLSLVFDFIIIFIFLLKKRSISKIILYIVCYFIFLFLITFIKSGSLSSVILMSVSTITKCIVADYGIRYNTKIFFKAFEIIFSVLIYINFITLILYPNGLYKSVDYVSNWFLGFKNLHILYILPAILSSFINNYMNNKKITIRNILLIVISAISLILGKSSTGIIGFIVVFISIILWKIIEKIKYLNIKSVLISYIFIYIGVVFLKIQNLFSFFIENILHKDLTFTNRLYIWEDTIKYIKEDIIVGHGILDSLKRLSLPSTYPSYHAHNQILEVLFQGGVVGFTIFLFIVKTAFNKLYLYKDKSIVKLITIFIFSYIIMMITEAYNYIDFFYIFVICNNIDYIIKSTKNKI